MTRNEEYFVDGLLHREDGPAVIINPLIKKWYKHGKKHRVDGPAYQSGSYEEWWIDDNLHREDGPAVIGGLSREWWSHGKRHRLDGPAVERDMKVYNDPLFEKEWWLFGVEYKVEEEYRKKVEEFKNNIVLQLEDIGIYNDIGNIVKTFL